MLLESTKEYHINTFEEIIMYNIDHSGFILY